MPYTDLDDDPNDDDEDWYDSDDEESDEEVPAPCPNCGAPVYSFSDACSKCGYWLTEADRRAMWANESKPAWIKITVVILLLIFLFGAATLIL